MKQRALISNLVQRFNMKTHLKILTILIFSLFFNSNLSADIPHFVDFKYILNQSDAEKSSNFLKEKLNSGIKKLQNQEKTIQEEEKKIIQQKKIISNEEYKKKVTELRKKVASLQKERQKLLDSVAKQRAKAKQEILKNLNPIIKEYMKEKKIRMVVDKKGILLADENLDLTKEITTLLNKKLNQSN